MALPLIFELGLVAGLAFLINQAERARASEMHAMAVTAELDSLLRLLLERSSSNVLRHMTGSREYEKAFHDTSGNMKKHFEELERLCLQDAKEMNALRDLEQLAVAADLQLREARDSFDSGDKVSSIKAWLRMRSALKKVYSLVDEELARETTIRHTRAEEQARTRAGIEALLICGAAGNVVLAIVLSLLFNRNTTERLNLLMQNTLRYASDQPLHPPLRGGDEMAKLDSFFRNMARSLSESRRKERAVLDNALDIICSLDSSGRFSAINPACHAIWGYSPDELIGKRLITIVPQEETDRVSRIIAGIIESQRDGTFDCRVRKADRSVAEMQWLVHWSSDEKSLFCVAHDISERKKLERMKRDFIAMVSHDLKTPLTSIQMVHSLLAENFYGKLNEEGQQSIEIADANVSRLIALVNDLLDIERIESGELNLNLEPMCIFDLVEVSVESIKLVAEKAGVKVVIECEDEDLELKLDKDRIAQVLINLLSNAIKFSAEGTTIRIVISGLDNHVEIRVIDQGRGIPEDAQAAIFERFKQVDSVSDRKKGGAGLGLAISKAIVERHGGKIGVESKPGEGSCFYFLLPKGGPNELTAKLLPESSC